MAPTPPPIEINLEVLHYIPKRAVIDALRINPTQRYVPLLLLRNLSRKTGK